MKTKHIILAGLTLSFFIFSSFIPKNDNPVTLTLHLSPEITSEDQWIYWFSLYQNEYDIVDSCFVRKKDSICQMSSVLDKNYELTIYIIACSKKGSNTSALSLLPGENVDVFIKDKNFIFLETKGSSGTEEMYDYFVNSSIIQRKINNLKKQLENNSDAILVRQLSDSLRFYNEYFNKGVSIELFNKAIHPRTYSLMLTFLESEISDQEEDSLIRVFKSKFPNSSTVQSFLEKPQSKPTVTSIKAHQRYQEILKGKNLISNSDAAMANIEVEKRILNLGDKIDGLSLESLSGNSLSLDSIKTPYILIDFWASWCVPCIREFPNLKNADKTYKDLLTIYAISLCNDQEDWRNSVNRYEVGMFSNVYGGSTKSFAGQSIMGRFGVTSIPANFLLDKDRKIIAMNLRGKALEEKMKELTGK